MLEVYKSQGRAVTTAAIGKEHTQMGIKKIVTIMLLLLVTGCYGPITGTVVDSETGKPVEGAVVLVEWTKTKGLGLTYHKVEKIIEVETDNHGKFNVGGVTSPFADSPIIVIYKKGYVAWRNDYIFPGWEKRARSTDQYGLAIRLAKWRREYSHDDHHLFMGHGIMIDSLNLVPIFHKALNNE